MTLKIWFIIFFSLLIQLAQAQSLDECDPSRDQTEYFCISPEMAPNSLVTKSYFQETPRVMAFLFNSELLAAKVVIDFRDHWESPYFGASVNFDGNHYQLNILGGLARIKEMTPDAYAAIVCHELGHILGGAPFQDIPDFEWASVEGQADYFSASVCLPRYFSFLNIPQNEIPSKIEKAGFEFLAAAKPFSSETSEQALIRFLPYNAKISATNMYYPEMQCRYENYRNPKQRPLCWYNPKE
ncbi:MAG: hypothetical protein AB7I27_11665 [Bacteriovoracaceae bacterium]